MTRAVSPATGEFPAEPEAMRVLLLTIMAERDAAIAERDALAVHNERLQALLLKLKRMQFGRKSEQLPEEQFALALEDVETAIARTTAEIECSDPVLRRERAGKRRAGRGALPDHLPRVEIVLAPDDTACPCCKVPMAAIGEERSERLDKIPAQYRVLVTRRPKFACRSCAGVMVQEPAPARLIEGGLPTEAVVADVVVSRFADHQPLYRHVWMAPALQGKSGLGFGSSLAVMCPASLMRSTQTAGPDGSRTRKPSSKWRRRMLHCRYQGHSERGRRPRSIAVLLASPRAWELHGNRRSIARSLFHNRPRDPCNFVG